MNINFNELRIDIAECYNEIVEATNENEAIHRQLLRMRHLIALLVCIYDPDFEESSIGANIELLMPHEQEEGERSQDDNY